MNPRVCRLLFGASIASMIGLALFILPAPARANGAVTSCTEAGLDAALSGGGAVTFNCNGSNSPATILRNAPKVENSLLGSDFDGSFIGAGSDKNAGGFEFDILA
jgi:hypothetical protein